MQTERHVIDLLPGSADADDELKAMAGSMFDMRPGIAGPSGSTTPGGVNGTTAGGKKDKSNNPVLIICLCIGGVLVILLIILIVCCCGRRKEQPETEEEDPQSEVGRRSALPMRHLQITAVGGDEAVKFDKSVHGKSEVEGERDENDGANAAASSTAADGQAPADNVASTNSAASAATAGAPEHDGYIDENYTAATLKPDLKNEVRIVDESHESTTTLDQSRPSVTQSAVAEEARSGV